ncbi:MAG: HAMP domain-containing protein [Patescibacteria group bacterium]
MKSIKGRLLFAFLAVVALLIVTSVAFFGLQVRLTEQYKTVSDTMIAEYRLVDTSAILINAFNTRVKSAGIDSTESIAKIETAKKQIHDLTLYLDSNIEDTESKSNYIGFKASVETLLRQIDASIVRFEEGSIKDYVSDYNEANKEYGFVRDNGTALVFSQLKYSSSIRDEINRQYLASLYIGGGVLLVLVLGCVFFILQFATRLANPIRNLTLAAQHIAAGKMNFVIEKAVLEETNEIGILARSFLYMERALEDKIAQLDASNKEVTKNADIAINKNTELERLNKLMVDRELRMIELKKQNEALQLQLKSKF